MGMVFTELVRWAFVALALYILLRSIVSLLRSKSYAEVWAYLHLETLKPLKDDQFEMTEISVGKRNRPCTELRCERGGRNHIAESRDSHARYGRQMDLSGFGIQQRKLLE